MLTYYPGTSFLHKLDPTLKLFLALVLSASCFVVQAQWFVSAGLSRAWLLAVLGALLVLMLLLGAACGLFQWTLRSIWGLLKTCAILFLINALSVQTGAVLLQLTENWAVTWDGLYLGAALTLRITASAIPLALILRVTKPLQLANSLYKHLHLPFKYAFAFAIAMRFIPIFVEEMAEIMEAQAARGVEIDTRNIFKKIAMLLPLCVPLLLSSVRKIEVATISAELRGFGLR
ncbi:MAG: energy-coupling factor transporter transmembrane protein EcfT [Oscillospiraceae bacterium]|jgi:energy-coupling factor transport system permease protein|nr:energy-coupling factor transporter transmembrane protein EcfT [Oscillospiraceae bacterium]